MDIWTVDIGSIVYVGAIVGNLPLVPNPGSSQTTAEAVVSSPRSEVRSFGLKVQSRNWYSSQQPKIPPGLFHIAGNLFAQRIHGGELNLVANPLHEVDFNFGFRR
jgi:hypothetical protein